MWQIAKGFHLSRCCPGTETEVPFLLNRFRSSGVLVSVEWSVLHRENSWFVIVANSANAPTLIDSKQQTGQHWTWSWAGTAAPAQCCLKPTEVATILTHSLNPSPSRRVSYRNPPPTQQPTNIQPFSFPFPSPVWPLWVSRGLETIDFALPRGHPVVSFEKNPKADSLLH